MEGENDTIILKFQKIKNKIKQCTLQKWILVSKDCIHVWNEELSYIMCILHLKECM